MCDFLLRLLALTFHHVFFSFLFLTLQITVIQWQKVTVDQCVRFIFFKKRVANKLMFSRLHSFYLFICSVCLYILSSGSAVKILLNLSDNISCGCDLNNNNSRWMDSAQRSRMRSLYHSVFNESHKLQSIFHKERNKKLI